MGCSGTHHARAVRRGGRGVAALFALSLDRRQRLPLQTAARPLVVKPRCWNVSLWR